MGIEKVIDYLHQRGISVRVFLDAMAIWEALPADERGKLTNGSHMDQKRPGRSVRPRG